jgi:hypothetical protein
MKGPGPVFQLSKNNLGELKVWDHHTVAVPLYVTVYVMLV